MATRFFIPRISETNPQVGKIITEVVNTIGPIEQTDNVEIEYADEIKEYDVDIFLDDLYDFINEYAKKTKRFTNFSFVPHTVYAAFDPNEKFTIRYKIIERTYATTEAGAKPHSGRRDYAWRCRAIVNDRENPGYKALIYTKPFDNTIELAVYSRNYRDANYYALQLEDLIDTYSFLFKKRGLLDIRYEGRKSDVSYDMNNMIYYGCILQYYVRTLKVKVVYEKTLEEIIIEVMLK